MPRFARLLAPVIVIVLLPGCGGDDDAPSATTTEPATAQTETARADAYRATVAKVSEALRGGPDLTEVRTAAEIRELAQYHVDAYREAATTLEAAAPVERARATQAELIATLGKDADELEQMLDAKAAKGKLYEAVTASRRDTLRLSDDLVTAAAIG